MTTPELLQYVRAQIAAGISRDTVQQTLLQKGWSADDVTRALQDVSSAPVPEPPARHPSHLGTKLLLLVGMVGTSVTYVLWQYANASVPPVALVQTTPAPATTTTTPAASAPPNPTPTTPVATTPKATPVTTPTPTPTPAPAPKPVVVAGKYRDGSYTGSVADAYYGLVQVQAVVTGGKVAHVLFLQYPNDRSTSQYINSQAMPMLEQEAIQAQSANVQIISGATDTSMAFQESLAVALNAAKN